MSDGIAIAKMHGARNDFVVLDRRRGGGVDDLVAFARWVCDRRDGIGADGLIAIEKSDAFDAGMRVINADGSEAEMCGNGVRCAARWLDEAGEGAELTFETAAGPVRTAVVAREPEYLVRVAMRAPAIAADRLTLFSNAYVVDLGNPHVVIFRPHADDIDLTMVAQRLQSAAQFPSGTNVHVAAVEADNRLRVRHWERGVGLSQACGTGAIACAGAAILSGAVHSPVEVFVPGGRLIVEWDGDGEVFLTGPAVHVFDTTVRVEVGAAR